MIEHQLTLCANGRTRLSGYASGLQFGYTHNSGVYRLGVTLADEWAGTTVRAFWHRPGQAEPLTTLVRDGSLNVPALVTAQSGTGTLTFEGSDGSRTVTSASIPYTVLQNTGTDDPDLPEPGTPAWQQFVALVRQETQTAHLSQQERRLILHLFQQAAYASSGMQASYDALEALWNSTPDTPDTPDQPTPPDTPDTPAAIPVSSVTLSKTTLRLNVGESATLTATISPSNATNKTVTWSVSPSGYATVSGGKVTAVKAGSCTVTAAAGGKSASCAVTVAQEEQQPQNPTEDSYGTLLYKLPQTTALDGSNYLDSRVSLFADGAAADWTVLAAYTGPVSCTQGMPNVLFCCCYDAGQGLLCRQAAKEEGWIVAGGRGAFRFDDSCFSYTGKTHTEILREDGKVNVVAVTKEGNNYAFYLNGVLAWNSPLEYAFDAAIPETLTLLFGARYSANGSTIEHKTTCTMNDARIYSKALSKSEVVEISNTLMGGTS